jgi:archaellum component FlaC
MEVVAAVSSVAGIASLVGQSLSGLSKLYDFFQGCQNASKTISRFLSELTRLEKAIREVEDLISKIGESLEKPEESILTSLTFHLEDCERSCKLA